VRYIPNEFNRLARNKFPSYKRMFPYRDMMKEEFDGNMQELLRMGDRMASAWGVENRCPFLDKRIIEFAYNLPEELKIQGMVTKPLLRTILKRRRPSYQFKEKHGLYCSVNEWLGVEDPFEKTQYLSKQEKICETLTLQTPLSL
jgi:asparagine synthetase B (glutamine-hydrolysing)